MAVRSAVRSTVFSTLLSATSLASGSPTEAYAANGFAPQLVADFIREKYFVNAVATTFAGMIDYTGGLSTMVDSDGVLKWSTHNDVNDPTSPATQNIVVVVGAKHTVEMTGAGSVTLSGAGSGSVTAGSPVEVTATTTTLTLTVVGTVSTMWSYRSDLGGMVDNPDAGSSYVPVQGVLPRRGNHKWNGTAWVNAGLKIESAAATNLLLNTATLATQSKTVTAVPHTLHFTGTGTVTLTGASTAGPLVGTGTGEENRVSLTFTPSAASLTLTVSGTVSAAQLEVGSVPSSYIPTNGAAVTRIAQTASIAGARMPDYQTPTYIGPELVTNGTFDTDTTGWVAGFGAVDGTFASVGSELLYTVGAGDGASPRYTTPLTGLTIGQTYELRIDAKTSVGAGDRLLIWTGSADGTGGGAVIQTTASGWSGLGSKSYVVIATATTMYVVLGFASSVAGDTLGADNISVREIEPLAVSIALKGDMTGATATHVQWQVDASNLIKQSAASSTLTFAQETAGTLDTVVGGSFTAGVNTTFNIASRHGSTFINGAVSGSALTANTTPTAIADLSGAAFELTKTGIINLGQLVVWPEDIGDTGIEEASS